MTDVQPWIIRQLRGDLTVTLAGYAAPFGRPRKGAVVEEVVEVRQEPTRYGGVDAPTRHVFGLQREPLVLHGRWMDSALGGPGTARAQRNLVRDILKAQRPVLVTWGPVLAVEGLLSKLTCGWESQHECTWELEIEVDYNEDDTPVATIVARPVSDHVNQLIEIFGLAKDAVEGDNGYGLKLPLQDNLALLLNAILQPIADLRALADELKSIKDGTIGQLRRLRAGINTLRQTFATFRGLFETASLAQALDVTSPDQEIRLQSKQAETGLAITEAFAVIAELDRQARRSEVQRIKLIVTGKPGDTWESLAVASYGDASRAKELRDTNDAGAEHPVPGETYIIPT